MCKIVIFFLYPGLTLVICSDSHRNSGGQPWDTFNMLGVELLRRHAHPSDVVAFQ